MLSCTFSTVFSVVGLTTDFCFPCLTGQNCIRGLCWAASTTNIPERMSQGQYFMLSFISTAVIWLSCILLLFLHRKTSTVCEAVQSQGVSWPKMRDVWLRRLFWHARILWQTRVLPTIQRWHHGEVRPQKQALEISQENSRPGTPGLQWALSRSGFCTFRKYLSRS